MAVPVFPTKATERKKEPQLRHDFSTLHYLFDKVIPFFLVFLLLWEEQRGLCAQEQLFNIL